MLTCGFCSCNHVLFATKMAILLLEPEDYVVPETMRACNPADSGGLCVLCLLGVIGVLPLPGQTAEQIFFSALYSEDCGHCHTVLLLYARANASTLNRIFKAISE